MTTTTSMHSVQSPAMTRIFDGTVKKGEIWNIDQGDTTSTGTEIWANRPAIIVSNDATNAKAGFVNVVYLTTSPKREMPYHVPIKSGDKMATALCEQIFAVDKSRISFYIDTISTEELLNVDKAILFSLGISNSLRPNTLFKKWVNAVARYNVDLTGNPLTNDDFSSNKFNDITSDTVGVNEQIIKERNMYRTLYENEKRNIEILMNTMAKTNT